MILLDILIPLFKYQNCFFFRDSFSLSAREPFPVDAETRAFECCARSLSAARATTEGECRIKCFSTKGTVESRVSSRRDGKMQYGPWRAKDSVRRDEWRFQTRSTGNHSGRWNAKSWRNSLDERHYCFAFIASSFLPFRCFRVIVPCSGGRTASEEGEKPLFDRNHRN